MKLSSRQFSTIIVFSLISALGLTQGNLAYAAPKVPKPAAKAPAAPTPRVPEAPGAAEAKKHFDQGLKLHREGLFQEALSEFQRAQALAPRASIQRNIAQCHRDMKDLPKAYEAYESLLKDFSASMRPAEIEDVKRVLEELSTMTGSVDVKIANPGVRLLLDDLDIGTTPLAKPLRVRVGPHRLLATKDGFQPLNLSFEVKGGEQTDLDGTLVALVSFGHVSIPSHAQDPTMRLFVDGKDEGTLPWAGDLKEGTHELRADGDIFFIPAQKIEVAAGSRLSPILSPQPYVARLSVDGHNPDARIFVNGKQVGSGLWEGELPVGRYQLKVAMNGFDSYEHTIDLHKAERLAQSVVLQPTRRPVEEKKTGKGAYFGIGALGAFGLTGSAIINDCSDFTPNANDGACSGTRAKGGGMDLRLGYSFGYIGLEAIAFGTIDGSSATVEFDKAVSQTAKYENPNVALSHYGEARTESYKLTRKTSGAALGLRFSSNSYPVGATLGAAFGFVVASTSLDRSFECLPSSPTATNCKASSSLSYTSNALYTVPAFLFDAGLEFGSPSTKFRIAAIAMVHMLSYNSNAPGSSERYELGGPVTKPTGLAMPDVTVFRGTQVFIGPQLSLQFGL